MKKKTVKKEKDEKRKIRAKWDIEEIRRKERKQIEGEETDKRMTEKNKKEKRID